MIVPEYWAEASERIVGAKTKRKVKRFGWSDISVEEAQKHANQRVADAIAEIKRGEMLPFTEPKVAYNGADGLPIREEIIDRRGDAVLTRNAYGALCLNTPDILFADVDVPQSNGCAIYVVAFVVSVVLLFVLSFQLDITNPIFLVLFLSMLSAALFGSLIETVRRRVSGTPETIARKRIASFAKSHPEWKLRLYETPMGYRVLVTHATFDPRGAEALDFFDRIKADPVYVRMCFNQNCFRARVSPKPWRVGMSEHMKPRPGVWPISSDRLPAREAWVKQYDQARQQHAACRYVDSFGNGRPCQEANEVQRWHDDLSAANQDWPIA
ncbi:MAG TPA: hypothetical protein DDX19_24865 [Rhodopirellula baltica]|uniref:Transmembrane protein n=1 Tax=Rhodopirellula baltica (strain DSM 10527 / NCIMB 13988 / SH1) TaxID=243090 RepID=Q7UKT0_RHOBA|nr:hypothetical protein [Rhodopirellula baltica]CAD76552.1 hypothetical protein-transmembrane prediction [Rhodopirellula baltica SH 1]HBE65921.1 hypothetical protein [Rhodopirellula baltica]